MSIAARSTPSISPTSGASPAIGPPSWPVNTFTSLSACSSVAFLSTNTPSRQFPSVMTFGVSAIAAILSLLDVRALDLALANVKDERDAAVVVRRAVVEGRVARTDQVARARLDAASFEGSRPYRPPSRE